MQLEFSWRDEHALRQELESYAGVPVVITVTDNSSSMLSVKPNGVPGGVHIRMHHMFLGAEPRVVKALAAWVTKQRSQRAGAVIDAFIRDNQHLIRTKSRRESLRTRGRVYDLKSLYDEVNADQFESAIQAAITWGRFPNVRRRRSIRFGSYTVERNLIRIHPYLDQEFVPRFYIRYVVFHEMLHADLGIEEGPTGRRRIHTREFKTRERRYPDFDRAIAWESNPANLRRLLRHHDRW